jgi:hypothetical protein
MDSCCDALLAAPCNRQSVEKAHHGGPSQLFTYRIHPISSNISTSEQAHVEGAWSRPALRFAALACQAESMISEATIHLAN